MALAPGGVDARGPEGLNVGCGLFRSFLDGLVTLSCGSDRRALRVFSERVLEPKDNNDWRASNMDSRLILRRAVGHPRFGARRMGARAALIGVGSVVALGLFASTAYATAYAQWTLPFTDVGPYGVAVDSTGDVFVADRGHDRVVELPAGGGPQLTLPFIGLNEPSGVAVSADGAVFVADSNNSRVVELPPGGASQITVASTGLSFPVGVAVDGAGDVFVTDAGDLQAFELPGGAGPPFTLPLPSASDPFGIAADADGDVFVTLDGALSVDELPAGNASPITLPFTLASPPGGVAVGPAGDVFVTEPDLNEVVEWPAAGGPQVTLPFTGLSSPYGVAADAAGDVIATSLGSGANRVVELSPISPAFQPTSLSSSLSGGGQNGAAITVPSGTAVSDQATLSGTNAASAGGTVTYSPYSDPECSVPAAPATTVSVTDGVIPASPPVTLTEGSLYWTTSYSGDVHDGGSQTSCGSETAIVLSPSRFGADVAASLQIEPSSTVAVGEAFSLDVTVTNYGPKLARSIVAGLLVPTGLSVDNRDNGTELGGLLTWHDDTLAPAETITYSVGVTASLAAFNSGTVTVDAGAVSLGTLDPNYTNNFISDSVEACDSDTCPGGVTSTATNGSSELGARRASVNDRR